MIETTLRCQFRLQVNPKYEAFEVEAITEDNDGEQMHEMVGQCIVLATICARSFLFSSRFRFYITATISQLLGGVVTKPLQLMFWTFWLGFSYSWKSYGTQVFTRQNIILPAPCVSGITADNTGQWSADLIGARECTAICTSLNYLKIVLNTLPEKITYLLVSILLSCYFAISPQLCCGLWILKKFLSHNLECIVYAQQGIRRFTFQTIHHKKNAELKLTQQKRPKEPNCIFFILRLNIFKLHLTEECYIYRSSRIQDGGNLPVVCADRQCVYMT